MADLKISQLTGASTPLAGTEVLPIVQSGSTVKVSVANLTAGRAVGMAGGSFTDNITQSTAAKGINFTANTNAPGMTSELLNWYEEGTWTPTDASGAGLSLTITQAVYTRIGRMVYASLNITFPTTVNGSTLILGGLPFISKNTGTVSIAYTNEATCVRGATSPADDVIFVLYDATGTALVNSAMSGDTLRATVIYQTG